MGARRPVPWGLLILLLLISPLCGAVTVEYFFNIGIMSIPDPTCTGGSRDSIVVNNQWPGPTIEARDGDTIMIHVINLQSLPVTIHIHGLASRDAQWYDGVPGVTQCPIQQGRNFTIIQPIKGQWGTFWYHAHTNQMRNTLHGAVIIRPPDNSDPEPINVAITGELLLLGGDWYSQTPQQLDATILQAPFAGYPLPSALHINGKTLCRGPHYFVVKRYRWYRMRIINTALWGSYNLRIENHKFQLLEAEGGYLQQLKVSMLDVYPGQSYSILLYTNQKPKNYWVALNSRYDVEKSILSPALAVLVYEGSKKGQGTPNTAPPQGPQGATRNQWGITQQSYIKSLYRNNILSNANMSRLIVLEINQNTLSTKQQIYSLNNVSFTQVNPTPLLLADYAGNASKVYSTTLMPDEPPEGLTAQKDGPTKRGVAVIELEYGTWVQIVFQNHNPPGGLHPLHLHGQNFFVVAQGQGTFVPSSWLSYSYNLINPPLRNTVALFDSYWTAIRFQASNPGQWILHCHLEQHADQGLIAIIKVKWPAPNGNAGPQPLGKPPADYPVC